MTRRTTPTTASSSSALDPHTTNSNCTSMNSRNSTLHHHHRQCISISISFGYSPLIPCFVLRSLDIPFFMHIMLSPFRSTCGPFLCICFPVTLFAFPNNCIHIHNAHCTMIPFFASSLSYTVHKLPFALYITIQAILFYPCIYMLPIPWTCITGLTPSCRNTYTNVAS
ncbi:hypothetical protein BKA70DRAFT_669032 [Coprinopsis sp. MPI-PUGE-AT-0042]|nr:hypothetical protein BKA70DRAFT_669032 [Coprinopsis sp. MPI-PUGE-AT-0042]